MPDFLHAGYLWLVLPLSLERTCRELQTLLETEPFTFDTDHAWECGEAVTSDDLAKVNISRAQRQNESDLHSPIRVMVSLRNRADWGIAERREQVVMAWAQQLAERFGCEVVLGQVGDGPGMQGYERDEVFQPSASALGRYRVMARLLPPATPLDLIGNTPLIRLERIDPNVPRGVEVYAKAEWMNPGGSVKDRPALWMIRDGIERGLLKPGMSIADATSGNTGIAYATIGAALGYRVTLAMPSNASQERKRMLHALGAEVILTDAAEGMERSIQTIRDLVASDPQRYFYPDQYNNLANPRAHYETTGVEIWEQTRGRITHFVAALGTSGTFMGTTRRLREYKADTHLIAVQPDGPYHALEGVRHMASTSQPPDIYDPTVADETIVVRSEAAMAMARQLARREGLQVGISAAANVVAALEVAHQLESGVVVTILCDGAARYLSDPFWDEQD